MTTLTYLFILVFLIGLYFYSKADSKYAEGLTNNYSLTPKCPNLLIQKGSRFYLYNSKLAQVPGVNPVEFDNLEDYTEFLDWQRSQNIRCPVLYLQETYDAQGNRVYKARPSISEPQAGLPPSTVSPIGNTSQSGLPPSTLAPIGIASQVQPLMETGLEPVGDAAYPNPTLLVDATRNDPPYNTNSYPAYDQTSYYIGTTTPLDQMNYAQESAPVSPDPMDPNWGGSEYTQSLIDKGYYKENNVAIFIP
jgi:hypothetical protein